MAQAEVFNNVLRLCVLKGWNEDFDNIDVRFAICVSKTLFSVPGCVGSLTTTSTCAAALL